MQKHFNCCICIPSKKTGTILYAIGTKFIDKGRNKIYIDDNNKNNYPGEAIIEITKDNQSETNQDSTLKYSHHITNTKYKLYESLDNPAFDKDLSYGDLSNFDFTPFTNFFY